MKKLDCVYCMRSNWHPGAVYAELLDEAIDPYALLRAEIRPTKPVPFQFRAKIEQLALSNIISMPFAIIRVVSQKCIETMEAFRGWNPIPIDLSAKNRKRIAGYFGLAVTGRAGPPDHAKSRIASRLPLYPNENRREVWSGLWFDHNTWDGSDVFTLHSTTAVLVNSAVKEAFLANEVTGVCFEPLDEIENFWSPLPLPGVD